MYVQGVNVEEGSAANVVEALGLKGLPSPINDFRSPAVCALLLVEPRDTRIKRAAMALAKGSPKRK